MKIKIKRYYFSAVLGFCRRLLSNSTNMSPVLALWSGLAGARGESGFQFQTTPSLLGRAVWWPI